MGVVKKVVIALVILLTIVAGALAGLRFMSNTQSNDLSSNKVDSQASNHDNTTVNDISANNTDPNKIVNDKDAPIVSNVKYSKSSNGVELIIDATDVISSDNIEYSFDHGETWSNTNSKVYKGNTLIKIGDIQIRDEAGNIVYVPKGYQITMGGDGGTCEEIASYYTKNNMAVSSDAKNIGYVTGITATTFEPDKEISRAEMATILYRVIDFGSGSNIIDREYTDLTNTHWAYDYVTGIQAYNLFDTENSEFLPNQAVTRAELAHALCQFIDLDGISTDGQDLIDIIGHRYEEDILKVSASGIMSGYGDGKFGPDDCLTRAQVVVTINRVISINEHAAQTGKQFDDVSMTHWAYNDILKASY